MITKFKLFEYNKIYISAGDIIVMSLKQHKLLLSDENYEIIQDIDDNFIWTYEHNVDGGNLIRHNSGTFNWWLNSDDNVKIFSVDKFIKEYPRYKEEILHIYSKKTFELVHDAWSKNEDFLAYVEAEKYNL